jgi:pimeloyl-ACP methyl ester carboxylesterase
MTTTDIVVVLPGITGSALAKDGQLVWAPSAGALVSAIRTMGRSIKQLKLPNGIGDESPQDGVEAVSIIRNLHSLPGVWSPFDGYTRLLRRLDRLRQSGGIGAVLPFPYDWRLSNRYNGRRLSHVVDEALGRWRTSHPSRSDAKVVLIGHSMGGLVARWYVEHCGGAEVTRKLITVGTPYRGSARAIDQLVNGVRYGIGSLAFDLTEFARSLPASYQLLPDYACVETDGSLKRVDEVTLPNIDTAMLLDSVRFHFELATDRTSDFLESTHAIVGTRQPTSTTARPTMNGVQMIDTINGDNDFGDGTVPLVGGIGFGLPLDTNRISRISDTHGQLQSNPTVLDEIEAIIAAKPVRRRASDVLAIGIRAPDIVVLGDALVVSLELWLTDNPRLPAVQLEVDRHERDGSLKPISRHLPDIHKRPIEIALNLTESGSYRLRVSEAMAGSHVAPATTNVLVWPNVSDPSTCTI